MNSNERSLLLKEIFSKLKKNNINYCILRNYENLPQKIGHDIDILLNKKDNIEFNNLVNLSIIEFGWNKRIVIKKFNFKTIVLYKVNNEEIYTIKFDIWNELSWRGVLWVDSNYVLNNVKNYKNFKIPREGSEAAITVLKEMTGGGDIPKKYYGKIKRLALKDKKGFIYSLKTIYGDYSYKLYNAAISEDWRIIDNNKKKIKNKIFSNSNNYNKIKEKINFFKFELIRRIKNWIKPKGGLVTFIGPDGSGKSTIINLVNKKIEPFFSKGFKYHMNFNIFPEIKTGLGLTTLDNNKDDKETKSKKSFKNLLPVNFIRSISMILVLIYYTLEFLIGRFIIKRIINKSGIIFFDRYYYDFFVKPYYRELIWPIKNILLFIIPTPRVIIHLDAKADTIYKRKQELNLNEIKVQNNYFRKLVSNISNSYRINTENKTIQQIKVETFKIILENF